MNIEVSRTLVLFLILSHPGVSAFCLINCEEPSERSESQATSVVNLNGNDNVINYVDRMHQMHDEHLTHIKVGVFTLVGIVLLIGLGVLIWYLRKKIIARKQKKNEKEEQTRFRRVLSMVRHNMKPKNPEIPLEIQPAIALD